MKKGLFFDGIYVFGNHFSVNQGIEDPVTVITHMANSKFIRRDLAAVVTEMAPHQLVGQFFVK